MKFIIIGITVLLTSAARTDATPTFPRVQRQLEHLQQQIINSSVNPLETHISDYRGNKRSDSRADKPELLNNSTEKPPEVEPVSIKLTPSSTLNIRRDAYANFLGNAIHNFRKGFRNAVEHVQSRLQRQNARLTANTSISNTTIEQTTHLNNFNVDDITEDIPPDNNEFSDDDTTPADDDNEENTQNLQIIQIISNIFQFLRSPHNGGANGRNETEFRFNIRKLKTLLLERKIKKITEFIINPLIISMNNLTSVLNGNGAPSTTEMVDMINEKLTADENLNDDDIDYMTSSGSSLLNREQARNLDNYGIMIMEVFGSVIGLTWGFISQIKGFLMRS